MRIAVELNTRITEKIYKFLFFCIAERERERERAEEDESLAEKSFRLIGEETTAFLGNSSAAFDGGFSY